MTDRKYKVICHWKEWKDYRDSFVHAQTDVHPNLTAEEAKDIAEIYSKDKRMQLVEVSRVRD